MPDYAFGVREIVHLHTKSGLLRYRMRSVMKGNRMRRDTYAEENVRSLQVRGATKPVRTVASTKTAEIDDESY